MDAVGSTPLPPTRIADYRVVRELGEGNHGRFYLARPPSRLGIDSELVALKVFSGGCSQEAFERSVKELRAFAAVRSRHLVPVYDAVLEDNFLYAMQYCPLGSLAASARPLSRSEALEALRDAALATHALHEAGLAHTDIKPGNVLVVENGGRLSDLGLARFLAPGNTVTGLGSVGSIEFVDPEILHGGRPSRASDIWSLGATLHRVLSGRGLYGEIPDTAPLVAMRRILTSEPRIDPSLSGGEREAVADCLAPVRDRVPTAAALAERVDGLIRTPGVMESIGG